MEQYFHTQIHNEKEKGKKITKIFHSPLHLELTLYPLQKLSKGADETIKIHISKQIFNILLIHVRKLSEDDCVEMTSYFDKHKYKIQIQNLYCVYCTLCIFCNNFSPQSKGRVQKNKMV